MRGGSRGCQVDRRKSAMCTLDWRSIRVPIRKETNDLLHKSLFSFSLDNALCKPVDWVPGLCVFVRLKTNEGKMYVDGTCKHAHIDLDLVGRRSRSNSVSYQLEHPCDAMVGERGLCASHRCTDRQSTKIAALSCGVDSKFYVTYGYQYDTLVTTFQAMTK